MSNVGRAPSGFVLEPDISDTGCNAGHGVRLNARFGDIPVVASGTMADGSTLIAFSGYPTLRSVVLHSVTPLCAPNRAFGNGGVATITLPLRPRPGHPPADGVPPNGLWVNAVAPRRGGGATWPAPMETIGWSARSLRADGSTRRSATEVGQCCPFPGK
jgi:hypothetical protein